MKRKKGKKNIHFDSRFIVVIRQERTARLLDRLGGGSFASAESGREEGENEEGIPWKGGDTWLELSSLLMTFAGRRGWAEKR